jgi:serine/threonine protein phosphatase PrpC
MRKDFEFGNFSVSVVWATEKGFDKPENQDSILMNAWDCGFSIAVCDGLGSAKESATGSEEAARTLIRLANSGVSIDSQTLRKDWTDHLGTKKPSEYDTTAKYATIKKAELEVGGVGDGLIAVLQDEAFFMDNGHGTFSNQTSSVFSLYSEESFWKKQFPIGKATLICISTDGFSEDFEETSIGEMMKEMRKSIASDPNGADASLSKLLSDWPIKTNGDDKTAAFVYVRRKI